MNVYYDDFTWKLVRCYSHPPMRKVTHYILSRKDDKGRDIEICVRTYKVTFVNNRGLSK